MHPSVYKRPLLWLLAFVLLGVSCFYKPHPAAQDVSRFITKEPVTLVGRVDGFSAYKKDSHNVIVKVQSVNGVPATGRVYARIKETPAQWQDVIRLEGKLQKPYNVELLGNFAWGDYLAVKGVFAEIRAENFALERPAMGLFRAVRAVRQDILQTFSAAFGPELAGIAGGVVLGERGETDPALYTAFQDSGAIHLLVASGGNVGFVTLMVLGVLAWVGVGRRRSTLVALLAAGVYTLVAGADAPLVRAYFMAVCACVGFLINRNSGVFQGLLLSCLMLVAGSPSVVFETGFQMSFLATAAIIICLSNWTPPAKWPRAVRFFGQIFLATLSTQLALLPVFTNVFYKVSITGLLSNMLLVPLASGIMGLGFAFYALSCLHVGFVLQWALWAALWLFKMLVVFFASFSFSSLPAAAWPGWAVAAYYIGLFWVFNAPRWSFAKKLAPYGAALLLLLWAGQLCFTPELKIWLLREWNSPVILVRTKAGQTLLFGAAIDGEKLARAVLKSGVRRIDGVFLSTASAREQKGLEELQALLPVGQVFRPFAGHNWPGETAVFGPTRVTAQWGLHARKDGGTWRTRGYAGTGKESLSYQIEYAGAKVQTGSGNYWVQTPSGALRSEQNKTVFARI